MAQDLTQQLMDLLGGFSGQQNTLFIPRVYLAACDNDHVVALFLNQCVYWSYRGDSEGWFAKSHNDWLDELGMTEFQVRRAVKALEPFGIETKVRRSKFYSGKTTVHYRIDRKRVLETVLSKLSNGKLTNFGSMGTEETSVPLTESTTETTEIPFAPNNGAEGSEKKSTSATNKQKPAAKVNPIFDTIAEKSFNIPRGTKNHPAMSRVAKISHWLQNTGKVTGLSAIETPATLEQVEQFYIWYAGKYRVIPPKDAVKFAEHWCEYLRTTITNYQTERLFE